MSDRRPTPPERPAAKLLPVVLRPPGPDLVPAPPSPWGVVVMVGTLLLLIIAVVAHISHLSAERDTCEEQLRSVLTHAPKR